MKTINRLKQFIDEKGISLNAFDASIGAANGYIGKTIKNNGSIGSDVIEKIVAVYPELDIVWLITGKEQVVTPIDNTEIKELNVIYNFGAPQVISLNEKQEENIVYVPVKARAGYLAGYGDPEFIGTLPTLRIPGLNNATYRMFEAEGPSMAPNIMSGDRVIGQWVDKIEDVRDNRVYVIVCHNGVIVKRVLNRYKQHGKLYIKSDTISHRADHPSYMLDPSEIREIWYCRLKLSPDFSEPSEIYHKINDLEVETAVLKQDINEIWKRLN